MTPLPSTCRPTAARRTAARRCLLMGMALVPGAALVAFGSATAWAQAPAQVGWWTQANPGSVEGSPTPPAPPDVPAGGMLVEGSMSSSSGASDAAPGAFGAVVYQVPSGQRPASLTLDVAAGSGTTPAATLELCPLSSPAVNAEQGGPMSDAPGFSCTTNVTAQPSSSGNSYSFDLSQLTADGAVAVAVLPTAPTDRVVLDKPGAASLSVHPSGTGAAPAAAGTGSGAGAGGAAGGGAGAGAQSGAAGGGTPGTSSSSSPGGAGTTDPGSAPAALPDPAASLTPAPAGSLPAASAPVVPGTPQAAASTTGSSTTGLSTTGSSTTGSSTTGSSAGSAAPVSTPAPSADSGGPRPAAVAALVVAFLIGAAIWLSAGRAAARAAARGMIR